MRFCPDCDNMLYLKLHDPDECAAAAKGEEAIEVGADVKAAVASAVEVEAEATIKKKKARGAAPPPPQPDKIALYCRQCDYVEDATDALEPIELVTQTRARTEAQLIGPYTRSDPTLPRRNDVVCPNPKCTRTGTQPNDAVVYRVNYEEMAFVFICAYCNEKWAPTRPKK